MQSILCRPAPQISAMSHKSELQILLDEELALEIAADWSSTSPSSNERGKIAIRNFHLLRRAAKVASTGSMDKSKLIISCPAHLLPAFVSNAIDANLEGRHPVCQCSMMMPLLSSKSTRRLGVAVQRAAICAGLRV